jgi:hypothetical protein
VSKGAIKTNTTGFTPLEFGFGAKWLELLKEIAPTRGQLCRSPPVGCLCRTPREEPLADRRKSGISQTVAFMRQREKRVFSFNP